MAGGLEEGRAAGGQLGIADSLPVQRQPDETRKLFGRHQQRAEYR